MNKKVTINNQSFRVNNDEYNKIDNKEYSNLNILDQLGFHERLISLLRELSNLYTNSTLKMNNVTHKNMNSCNCPYIKDLPLIFCINCGELQCNVCNLYNKCSSCLSFSCNKCIIKLLCNHNYCSINCVLDNSEEMCTKKCIFLRDLNSTGTDDYGLKNLLDYWYKSDGKKSVIEWIEWIEWIEMGCDKINEKIIKLKYLL